MAKGSSKTWTSLKLGPLVMFARRSRVVERGLNRQTTTFGRRRSGWPKCCRVTQDRASSSQTWTSISFTYRSYWNTTIWPTRTGRSQSSSYQPPVLWPGMPDQRVSIFPSLPSSAGRPGWNSNADARALSARLVGESAADNERAPLPRPVMRNPDQRICFQRRRAERGKARAVAVIGAEYRALSGADKLIHWALPPTLPMNLPFKLVGTHSTASLNSPEKMGTRWNASLPGSWPVSTSARTRELPMNRANARGR